MLRPQPFSRVECDQTVARAGAVLSRRLSARRDRERKQGNLEVMMIRILEDLPPNVIGVELSGRVTEDDYAKTLVPQIEEKQRQFDKVRLLYVAGNEFDGYSAGALWEDTKVAFKRPMSWEKIAVVTDEEWLRRAIRFFSWIVPGEVNVYSLADRERGQDWIAA
jgi:hypothetical protein